MKAEPAIENSEKTVCELLHVNRLPFSGTCLTLFAPSVEPWRGGSESSVLLAASITLSQTSSGWDSKS